MSNYEAAGGQNGDEVFPLGFDSLSDGQTAVFGEGQLDGISPLVEVVYLDTPETQPHADIAVEATPLSDEDDPYAELFASFKKASETETELDRQRARRLAPRQPAAPRAQARPTRESDAARDLADKRQRLYREAEFHPAFYKLPRAEVVELMLAEEEARAAKRADIPEYVPSYQTDLKRMEGYRERGLL